MEKLYLECFSGISGDMVVGALLDLGVDEKVLLDALATLPISGYRVEIQTVQKSGIRAKDFNVILDYDNHDHDMGYLYGHAYDKPKKPLHQHRDEELSESSHSHLDASLEREEQHEHLHGEDHHDHGEHAGGEEHGHDPHHEHRTMPEILSIIDGSGLTASAKAIMRRIFGCIANAEAKVHGTPVEKVHFHEVGAVDSIVDIAAMAICLDELRISEIVTPIIYEGRGTVRCQHGILPVPVPAVAEIMARSGIPLHRMALYGEFVTPTGAGFAAAMSTSAYLPDQYRIKQIGVGAGKRIYDGPGVLRIMIIE